ncbi:MAG TPA: alpha-L-rhamnosidase C-terminal domain-containing protein [Candidatus Acidoferrales bacterium]|jgi:alpha-L-rhamnosidase|nr:alpha-L-rhamnosidase C-terminal domain-containing protein [Candidatus Acidoferrales bacterium]
MDGPKWPITWDARWIWSGPAPLPVAPIGAANIPPKETWNRFCYLRRTVQLDAVPASVPARVTADSRFVLFVNGVEVARGPARSIPERLAWAEVDLAPYLHAGRNAIASLVRFYGVPGPWWRPAAPSFLLGFGSFAFEAPVIGVISDATWKGRAAPYRQDVVRGAALPVPPTEILDGAAIPTGWNIASFDDSNWLPAVELSAATFSHNRTRIPVEPFTAPEHDEIAPLTSIPIALNELSRHGVAALNSNDPRGAYPTADQSTDGPDTIVNFDAGMMTLATPWAVVRGPAGSTVDVYCGEDSRADGSAETHPREFAMRYILRGGDSERFESYEAVGFRYLSIVARRGAQIESAGAVERRYPRGDEAYFECDDPALNKIWRVGARTLELCSTDAFIDCPGREQRAWLGDSYIHALLTYTTNTDWRLVRRHLRICADSRRGDGLLAMAAACDFAISSTTIPDYSLHWIRALARYFEYSGDNATVRELMPTADGVVAAFERYRASDGLIRGMPGWIFIDWAMTERSEVIGALDALYAAALDDFASLAETVMADSRAAADARACAERTRRAFQLLWDEAAGVYVDAADRNGPHRRVSQQTNAIAIVAGCAPAHRWPRMLDYILDESRVVVTPTISDNMAAYRKQRMDPAEHMKFDVEQDVVAAQPFFSHILHDAIVRAGRRDLIPARCMKWWPQIERGGTAFEEYWDARIGTGSRCHAWSATPTYDLTTWILGVRPAAPGYSRAEIAPRFGALRHLEGRVPTPHGLIEVKLDREAGGEIALPDGVTALVRFDDASLIGGELGPGRHRISR